MHIRRGALNWGVFLILAGAVPLAVRAGYLTDEQVDRLWSLWPLILVGIGIGLILSRTSFSFLGGIVIAATFGLMVGGLLSGGVNGLPSTACGPGSGGTPFAGQNGTLGAATAGVDLQLDCGDITVAVAAGNAWRVEGRDKDGAGPVITSGDGLLRVKPRDESGFGPFVDRASWTVTLPDAPVLDLRFQVNAGSMTVGTGRARLDGVDIQLNAGSATVNLGSAPALGDLDVQMNAGSLSITLPNVSFAGSMHANAGSVKFCTPAGAGLRIVTGESIISSYDYAGRGLVQSGNTWTTPGYASAAVKIDLRTEANAGSFSLDPESGCG